MGMDSPVGILGTTWGWIVLLGSWIRILGDCPTGISTLVGNLGHECIITDATTPEQQQEPEPSC